MSTRATVLYDAPGPRGQQINRLLTAATIIITAAVLLWVGIRLNNNGQFAAENWQPFLTGDMWTTYILPGLWGTLKAAVASIILAIIVGTILGLGRLSEIAPVRWVCTVIVEFFRSIPVLLLMIFAYQVFAIYGLVPTKHLAFAAVIFGLTMYNGSVIAEILRSGIRSLPAGQEEAAIALGLSRRQTMFKILLPQAVASMLPALVSQMVIALKDSALGYLIGYVEVVRSSLQAASWYKNYLAAMVVVAIVMILVNYLLSRLAERMETQLRAGRARRNIVAKVPHQKDVGVVTKDETNVDWHNPDYRDLKQDY
ncbi:amino acid ABC transporter permease [Corynebacterium auriscanis]|uniref:Glutamate ABC transporter permease n=1 Tax=Corynebacterium auriscanis TaxID=99807 RepID=A0A0A2DJP5_9CORY|nr:amino acid ABC transporter permease [Corynebacterium auriscanis]KGM19415.1 glutamate ABC transporter permease [Corynebacterium auriscanis]MCX2162992.1 amino acid ABC transporter permease [Corynebacterium auriscanis]WJY72853.1 Arginine transport system permease protein ArtQ [Corynebacterium auriscanis]